MLALANDTASNISDLQINNMEFSTSNMNKKNGIRSTSRIMLYTRLVIGSLYYASEKSQYVRGAVWLND